MWVESVATRSLFFSMIKSRIRGNLKSFYIPTSSRRPPFEVNLTDADIEGLPRKVLYFDQDMPASNGLKVLESLITEYPILFEEELGCQDTLYHARLWDVVAGSYWYEVLTEGPLVEHGQTPRTVDGFGFIPVEVSTTGWIYGSPPSDIRIQDRTIAYYSVLQSYHQLNIGPLYEKKYFSKLIEAPSGSDQSIALLMYWICKVATSFAPCALQPDYQTVITASLDALPLPSDAMDVGDAVPVPVSPTIVYQKKHKVNQLILLESTMNIIENQLQKVFNVRADGAVMAFARSFNGMLQHADDVSSLFAATTFGEWFRTLPFEELNMNAIVDVFKRHSCKILSASINIPNTIPPVYGETLLINKRRFGKVPGLDTNGNVTLVAPTD